MAPTGIAAINISGTTIHSALAIPKESGERLPQNVRPKKNTIKNGTF